MKKVIAILLAICVFYTPFAVRAEGMFIDSRLRVKSDPSSEVVKELPQDVLDRIGDNYVAIDFEFLKKLEEKAAKSDVYAKQIDEMQLELTEFRTYSARLENVIKQQTDHIALLDQHIDYQEEVIKDLQPTWFSKNKFWFGMITGFVLMGGAAYGASQLD